METWKDVVGYEGAYQVSNLGNVKSLDRIVYGKKRKTIKGRVLSPVKFPAGYLGVQLCKDCIAVRHSIHSLVLLAFSGPREGRHADHIDYDRTNNKLSNLRWLSNLENQRHSAINREGLQNKSSTPVVHLEYGAFFTVQEAADLSGVLQQKMSRMLQGKDMNHTKFAYA